LRGYLHINLAFYCAIPLIIMVVLWLCEGRPIFVGSRGRGSMRPGWYRGRTGSALVACLLIASSGTYFAFFAAAFVSVAAVVVFLRYRRPVRLLDSLATLGLICGVFLLNLSPSLWYRHVNGTNPAAVVRTAGDSNMAGLAVSSLVRLVPYHSFKS